MMRRRVLMLGTIAVALLAACGGGGGGGSSVPPATPNQPVATSAPRGASSASFVLTIPAKASSAVRRTRYIDPNTGAIRFTLLAVNNAPSGSAPGAPVALDASVCTTAASGARSCTINTAAPVGSDIFAVETFSDTTMAKKLGGGIVSLNVVLNQQNSAGLTLAGAVDHVAITTLSGYLGQPAQQQSFYTYGSSGRAPLASASATPSPGLTSTRLYMLAFDAQNNVILDPTAFSTPVTIGVDRGDAVLLSVTHQDGSAGPATTAAPSPAPSATPAPPSAWSSVQVSSVADVVTVSLPPGYANPFVPYYGQWTSPAINTLINAWIGAAPATPSTPAPCSYYTCQGQQLPPYTKLVVNVPNTGTPPAPCPPGYTIPSGQTYCTQIRISVGAADATTAARLYSGYYYAQYNFTGTQDPLSANLTLSVNDASYKGGYTVSAPTANCPALAVNGTALTAPPLSANVYYCNYTISGDGVQTTLYLYRSNAQVYWQESGTYGRLNSFYGNGTARYEFPSLVDPGSPTLTLFDSNVHFAGNPTFKPDPAGGTANAAACGLLNFTVGGVAQSGFSGSGYTFTAPSVTNSSQLGWSFGVKIPTTGSVPTKALACRLIAVDSGGSTMDTFNPAIEIDVNNVVGGTIQ